MSAVVKKLLGPPGTGKTTTLLKFVEAEMDTTAIDKIGYFSFTRKAANEARDRAIAKFKLDKKDFKWFSTLHSCGYHSINLEGRSVMKLSQYKNFADKVGLRSKMFVSSDTGLSDNPYLNEHHLARARGISLEEHYKKYVDSSQIDWKYLEYISSAYEQYKEVNNCLDYTDMLYEAVNDNLLPVLDVVFIDEAQDLTPLQWAMVEHFASTAKRLYLAGDDDQAIYRWLGADVERFIDYPGEEIILPKSYRLKRKVQDFAQEIIKVTKNRISKEWEPVEEEGDVLFHHKLESVDFSKDKWLILARDRYILNNIEDVCRSRGLWYEKVERKDATKPIPQRVFDAIIGWKALSNGEAIEKKMIKKIFHYKRKPEDFDDKLKTLSDGQLYDLQSLIVVFGPFSVGEWQYALNKINIHDRGYLLRMEKNEENISETPRIRLSTIHGAKGGECDKVLLATDMSLKTHQAYKTDSDDEQRVFYVGATRAKEELHILLPQTNLHFRLAL